MAEVKAAPTNCVIHHGTQRAAAEFIEFFWLMFRQEGLTKQFASATKPFFAFGADIRKQPMVITLSTRPALPATDDRRPSDADHQLYPCFRPASGWSLDGWFFRPAFAGRRNLRLPWLPDCKCGFSVDGGGRQVDVTDVSYRSR